MDNRFVDNPSFNKIIINPRRWEVTRSLKLSRCSLKTTNKSYIQLRVWMETKILILIRETWAQRLIRNKLFVREGKYLAEIFKIAQCLRGCLFLKLFQGKKGFPRVQWVYLTWNIWMVGCTCTLKSDCIEVKTNEMSKLRKQLFTTLIPFWSKATAKSSENVPFHYHHTCNTEPNIWEINAIL